MALATRIAVARTLWFIIIRQCQNLVSILTAIGMSARAAYYRVVINSDQSRAAPALFGMSQITLAERAGVNIQVIKRFESGSDPRASTVQRN